MQYYNDKDRKVIKELNTSADTASLRGLTPGNTYRAALVAIRNGRRSDPVSPKEALYTRMNDSDLFS